MKVLIYTASSLCNPQFGIMMEHAIDYANRGNEVVFCHCDGLMSACSSNFQKNKGICKLCKLTFRAGLKNLPNNVKLVGMKPCKEERDYERHGFKSISDIKAYRYKDVELGFAVMSVYITKTRNPKPAITKEFLTCINIMLSEASKLVDAAESLIESEKPDIVMFFNGRFFDTKPFHDLSEKRNIKYIVAENVGGVRADDEYRMVTFENSIPHDSRVIYENCLKSWDCSARSEDDKVKMGIDFYERRRGGKRAGDYAYTASQIQGKLPDSFDPNKRNVVIFSSSEDEYSAVTSEIDNYFLFNSQYEGIKYICDNIGDEDYHFIVRIHPNMRGLDVEYHRNLYKLRELKNVTVIAPEETVSSYALMDAAYNIVVFGSTIGAESLFWGKPVVLLGFAEYYDWGVCSIPKSKAEVIEMIKNPKLYPGAREIAIKYGYFFLDNSLAQKAKHIDITPKKAVYFGKLVYVFDYLKLMSSRRLYKLVSGLFNKVLCLLYRNGIMYPEKIRN